MSDDGYGHVCTTSGIGKSMLGYLFDGIDDSIVIPTNGNIKTNQYTITGWFIQPPSTNEYRDIFDSINDGNGNNQGYHIRIDNNDTLYFRSGNGTASTGVSSVAVVDDNVWHWFACVLDGVNLNLHLDGAAVVQAARVAGTYYNTANPKIADILYGTVNLSGTLGELVYIPRGISSLELARCRRVTQWRYQ